MIGFKQIEFFDHTGFDTVLAQESGANRSLPGTFSGLGVIADNVIHIGTHLAEQARSR